MCPVASMVEQPDRRVAGGHQPVDGRGGDDRRSRRRPASSTPKRGLDPQRCPPRRRGTRRRWRCGTAGTAGRPARTRSGRRRWRAGAAGRAPGRRRRASSLWVRRWRGLSGRFGTRVSAGGVNSSAATIAVGAMPVVEQGRVGGEALLAHQLLGVEAAVGLAELGVPLARHLADAAVVRHLASRFVPFTGPMASDNRTLLSVPCSVP